MNLFTKKLCFGRAKEKKHIIITEEIHPIHNLYPMLWFYSEGFPNQPKSTMFVLMF